MDNRLVETRKLGSEFWNGADGEALGFEIAIPGTLQRFGAERSFSPESGAHIARTIVTKHASHGGKTPAVIAQVAN